MYFKKKIMHKKLLILNSTAKRNSSLHNKERDSLKDFINKDQNSTLGIFDKAVCCSSLMILMVNVALNAGSSKQGKADLAARGSN